jgi:hypothetical protein
MTDRHIHGKPHQIRAMMDGRQTQLRMPLEKLRRFGAVTEFDRSDTPGFDWHFRDSAMRWHDLTDAELMEHLPYQKGDRLWVRETHKQLHRKPSHPDFPPLPDVMYQDGEDYDICTKALGWKTVPSIHMPRWASRITLLVDDVKVQRLQDITPADAIAEGNRPATTNYMSIDCDTPNPVNGFRSLWNTLYPEQSWDANPWVVYPTFRVIKQNIDQIERTSDD